MDKEIVNKVVSSGIITIDLQTLYISGERVQIDLKEQLFQGMILREKDFREYLETHDWSYYNDKLVAVHCSADAIIPSWAYMLMATKLEPITKKTFFGSLALLEQELYREQIEQLNVLDYKDARVVVKGCADKDVPQSAYFDLSKKILPHVKSLMFGEPCSTVPVFKRK